MKINTKLSKNLKDSLINSLLDVKEVLIFENENGTVKILITRDEFKAAQSEEFISETFGGSLPMFLTAFTKRNKLSAKEIEEIKNLIDNYKEV